MERKPKGIRSAQAVLGKARFLKDVFGNGHRDDGTLPALRITRIFGFDLPRPLAPHADDGSGKRLTLDFDRVEFQLQVLIQGQCPFLAERRGSLLIECSCGFVTSVRHGFGS